MSARQDKSAAAAARKARRPQITPWKRVLLGIAALFVVVGGGLRAWGGSSAEKGSPSSSPGGSGVPGSTLVGQGGGQQVPGGASSSEQEGSAASEWSPFFLKGGFSFFIAFCVGYAMRVWLKVSFLVIGTFLTGVFLLSYFHAIDVNWETLQGWYDRLAGKVGQEASDFRTFLTGSLPQAGLASLGLVTGFKRR